MNYQDIVKRAGSTDQKREWCRERQKEIGLKLRKCDEVRNLLLAEDGDIAGFLASLKDEDVEQAQEEAEAALFGEEEADDSAGND